jgi:hypothetical protein
VTTCLQAWRAPYSRQCRRLLLAGTLRVCVLCAYFIGMVDLICEVLFGNTQQQLFCCVRRLQAVQPDSCTVYWFCTTYVLLSCFWIAPCPQQLPSDRDIPCACLAHMCVQAVQCVQAVVFVAVAFQCCPAPGEAQVRMSCCGDGTAAAALLYVSCAQAVAFVSCDC